jgi:hypothetical protein
MTPADRELDAACIAAIDRDDEREQRRQREQSRSSRWHYSRLKEKGPS